MMTKNFAHRGFSGKYPENTMLAFSKAIETGCDGIELDVQLTKDNELVIIHDEELKRTTGHSGMVKDFTLVELKHFDAGSGFGVEFGFNPIPTLREYFDYISDKSVLTNIELKNSILPYKGMEEAVAALIQEYGLTNRIIISSFNHFSVCKCKKLLPDVRCAFLTGCWQIGAGAYAKQNGVNYINPRYHFLTDDNISELNANSIGAMAWTVNDKIGMERLAANNIYAIITNHPDILKNVLDNLDIKLLSTSEKGEF